MTGAGSRWVRLQTRQTPACRSRVERHRRLYRSSLQKDSAVSASDERGYVSKNTG